MIKYNKLVRDKIIEIIQSKGEKAKFHIADEAEYKEKLFDKLKEETDELIKDPSISEVADVLEVVDAICKHLGFSEEEVREIKEKKASDRGGFEKKIILEES